MVVVWVLVARFILSIGPDSPANVLAPILFNVSALAAIYFGIKASQPEQELTFKGGIKTGMSIALVYAVSSCLFFFIAYLIVGPKLLANEPTAQTYPMWQVALLSYAAMFFGALIAGLIFSTIISFVLVKTRKCSTPFSLSDNS